MPDPTDNLPSRLVSAESNPANAPLRDVTVAVTRPANQSAHLAGLLTEQGAAVVTAPLIRIGDPDDPSASDRAIARIESFDWLVFTSANGASRFLDRLAALGRTAGSLSTPRIAAVGPATATAIRDRGGVVSMIPERFVADSLAEAFREGTSLAGARILLARASAARDELPRALREAGAYVETVDAYQTLANDDEGRRLSDLIDRGAVDVVTFASSSAVEVLARFVSPTGARVTRCACIGPVTAATAHRHGFEVWAQAADHTDEGLVRAIVETARSPNN